MSAEAEAVVQRGGPWSPEQVDAFLREAKIPLRVACHGTSGFPVLASLWFRAQGGSLWCATKRGARVVTHLLRNPSCAFEVSVEQAPYYGVRGQALATIHEQGGPRLLGELIDRYLPDPNSDFARSLMEHSQNEVAIELVPRACISWDFRARMGEVA